MATEKSIALVTGASSGIGQQIALRLAQDGFHVWLHFHQNQSGAQATYGKIRAISGSAEVIQFDVRDRGALEEKLDSFFKNSQGKKLQVLVNNAGIHNDGLAGMMSDKAFDDVVQTNLYGPFYLMRWCVRKMIRQRSGCIVNVSSLSGQLGNPGQINYAASKAALIAMTQTLSAEVGSRQIRVNAIAPGLISSEMTENLPGSEDLVKRIPLGRFGTPLEVAGAVSFLCSQDAAYITGHTLSVNGGLLPS